MSTIEAFAVATPARGAFFIMPHPAESAAFSVLAKRGVQSIVSLLEAIEADKLGLAREAEQCTAEGIEFRNMPIADFALPDGKQFADILRLICTDLEAGKSVAVHCRAGIGRSGMVACGVLMRFGATAQEALVQVSKARGVDVPDTAEQRAFIEDFRP
ncbi:MULTISPECIES: protein-tyrosine phosphatase family protein [Falsihalocynthiibacter]|uniref:protein-tyrosine phosphatase family protein n=2 Tax=Roseobacteraceae TaxID=2854170 RepID=UPI00387EC293